MDENKKDCPCKAVEQLIALVNLHDIQLKDHEEWLEKHDDRLKKHDERLERGNVDFAVISTKLNIIMAVLAAIGVAVCGAVVGLIL